MEYVKNLSNLAKIEQIYLNNLNSGLTYNICKVSGSRLNVKSSQETKNKISLANKGHSWGMANLQHSDETKALMSAIQKGITNRNLEKWPHTDGYYCECAQCKAKRNLQCKISRHKRLNYAINP